MQLAKSIREMMVSLGFQYYDEGLPNLWNFYRQERGVKQIVSFLKSNHVTNAFSVDLYTSVNRIPKSLKKFIPEEENDQWWTYQDNHSLKLLLDRIKGIISKEGLNYLNIMSRPNLEIPLEIAEYFRDNKLNLALTLIQTLGLKDGFAPFDVLEGLLTEPPKNTMEVNWPIIMSVGAYLGELLIQQFNGEWKWNIKSKQSIVEVTVGRQKILTSPLHWAVCFWDKPQNKFYKLSYQYDQVNHQYLLYRTHF